MTCTLKRRACGTLQNYVIAPLPNKCARHKQNFNHYTITSTSLTFTQKYLKYERFPTTNTLTCAPSAKSRRLKHKDCLSVLSTLRFSANFGLCFLWSCGLLIFEFVLFESCLLFALVFADSVQRIAFFSNCMALLLFQFTAKRNLSVFLCTFAHFRHVFLKVPHCFSL